MKVVAVIQANLETSEVGTSSRLSQALRGIPVLRRTVTRLETVEGIDSLFVLCPTPQQDACRSILEGCDVEIRGYEMDDPPWRSLVRSARKWSLDGWRGGVGGTSCFDEFVDCRLLASLIAAEQADAVLCVPAGGVLVDPKISDGMIDLFQASREELRLVFAQTPPGLAGVLLERCLINELAEKNSPLGWVLSYKPDMPVKDLITQPCCMEVVPEVRYASGRLIADTQRAMCRLDALLEAHADPDAREVGRWLLEQQRAGTDALPREIEIELTTDDPYPKRVLHPRGASLTARGPISVGLVSSIASELAASDDALIVLGGFGDPLCHPEFTQILRAIRDTRPGIFGLCVRTTAAKLTEAHITTLVDCGVDILHVGLDAWTPELYGQLMAPDDPQAADLAHVRENIQRLSAYRQQQQSVCPIVLADMTKAVQNVGELDAFHDGWLREAGAVTITGPSHYARQWEDYRVTSVAPPERTTCRRIQSRAMVLADGTLVMCDQDFRSQRPIGTLGGPSQSGHSLADLWQSDAYRELRQGHARGEFTVNALCAACDEWHRP